MLSTVNVINSEMEAELWHAIMCRYHTKGVIFLLRLNHVFVLIHSVGGKAKKIVSAKGQTSFFIFKPAVR